MFKLKFNKDKLTRQELHYIEKRYKQYLREKITLEFNVLNLDRTDLYAHVLSIFTRCNVHRRLHISVSQMLDFLVDVAGKYTTEASYHTFYHAADIVTVLCYLCHDLNAGEYLTDLDVTFLMVAALCHDAGHPGFNNAFQMNSKTELVEKYGAESVLETYSVDLTIQLFEKHDIKHALMNDTITDLILSTDMAYHKELEKQSKKLFTTWNNNKTLAKGDRLSLCRILLHAADISNMARPWAISKQWSDLIVKEFYTQGDEEKKRNFPVSPGMDRESNTQKNISLKFGEVILTFFQSLVSLLPKSHVLVDSLASNRIQWECLEQETKKRQLRRVSSDIPSIATIATITTTDTNIKTTNYKRIRLGCRSQSYPTTVLYCTKNHLDKPHNDNKLSSLITFKSTSIDETPNIIETIVLYHPYDK